MDVKKILVDLIARSERTTFENEREICLNKIQILLAKHNIKDVKSFIESGESGKSDEIPIVEIRNIFVMQFYQFFADDVEIDEFDNVPVTFDKYSLSELKSRCDANVVQFSKTAPNLAKVYGSFLSFVEGKLKELEIRNRILDNYSLMYDYILVPREIAYWISDKIDIFSLKSGTIEEVCKARIEKFLCDKKQFFANLEHGYYDNTIKRVIDIKALPSYEKPVSYTEKETSTIMSQIRSTKSFRTAPSGQNKKLTKKKKNKEPNWYLNLQSHSPF